MAKTHIGPGGPAECHASPGKCPYGNLEHYDSAEEAQAEFERRGAEAFKAKDTVKKPKKLTPREQELVNKNNELLRRIVALRADAGDVTYEDANPERAKRRLKEAIDYAESRGNSHLAGKLSSAKVLPSGAFKTAEGQRVNTDALLKKKVASNHIEAERQAMIASIQEAVNEAPPSTNKFSLKTDAGSFNATVSEGLNQEEFDKLPPKVQAACSSEKESLDLTKAREHLDPKTLHEITSKSQVMDYVIGKEPDVGQKEVTGRRELVGSNTDEKITSGLKNMSDFYTASAQKFGKSRDIKKELSAGSDAVKAVAAKHDGNTFAPARSQKNGALVTERFSVNPKKARELLTDAQLKKITVTKPTPDPERARMMLPDEQFGKIFKARKVSVRVTESK